MDTLLHCPTFFSVLGDVRTTLKAGTTFNETWHLGYPHQGGFLLELLDSEERHLMYLTPGGGDDDGAARKFVTGDTT